MRRAWRAISVDDQPMHIAETLRFLTLRRQMNIKLVALC